jgi:fructokinase
MDSPRPRVNAASRGAADGLVVVAGESLIDRIVRPDGRIDEVPGGGPFNTARALARLGVRTAFLGRLSTDGHGRRLRAALEAEGVELELAATTDDPTLIAVAELDVTGSATYRFEPDHSAASGLEPADVPDGLPDDTVALHVGTLGLALEPMATTIAGLVAGARPDVLVMVDPNIRPTAIRDEDAYRTRLAAVLARADLIKTSAEDLAWLDPTGSPPDVASELVDGGASAVIVTNGSASVEFVSRGAVGHAAVPPRKVVDTVGAGDAFSAGFLARWLNTRDPRSRESDPQDVAAAVRFGIAAAGWTVERAGADPPRPADLGDVS